MTMKEIAQSIPEEKLVDAWKSLVDLLLTSSKANRMPVEMSKAILSYWQRGTLNSREGFQQLLEAAVYAEREKAMSLLSEKLMLPLLAEMLAKLERR